MNMLINIFSFSVASLNIFLALFVISKNLKSLANIFFSFFSMMAGFWVLSIHLTVLTDEKLLFGRLGFTTVILSMAFLFLFIYVFPEKNRLSKKELALSVFLPVLFAIVSLTDLLVADVRTSGMSIQGDMGPFYLPYKFFVVFYILLIIATLLKKFYRSSGIERSRLRYVFLGTSLFIVPALVTNIVLPGFFAYRKLNFAGPLFSVFMVVFISYAIVRHNLLDIRVIIQRSLVYTTLLGLITSLYLSLVFVVGQIFQRTTDATILFSAGVTAILGILGYRPIEKYFSRLTDKIFFKDKYDYSKALRELSEILNVNLDLKILLNKASNKLEQIFKANKIEFIIKKDNVRFDGESLVACGKDCPKDILDKLKHYHEILVFSDIPSIIEKKISNNKEIKEALEKLLRYGTKNDFEVYVPILLKGKAIGMLSIGKKLSGDPYNQEDLNLLDTFSYQAAIALEKSRLYEAERKYAGELENKVKSRTAKIEKLQQEQKQMMIDISHGLQTPLAIVKGEAEFLQEELPDNKHVKVFEKSIDQVSKFIYDMLNLARLETTEEDFRKEKVDLSGLMEELVEYFDVLVKENDIRIEKDIEPGISVMGKKDKLEEMVNNLVSNSIKYIDNERIIRISLKKNKDKAKLIVEDTGIGINAIFIPNLFNRFYRVKDEKHSGIKGTGIGLSIVKQIAEKHGGTIRAESMEGKWTRMIVELKVAG